MVLQQINLMQLTKNIANNCQQLPIVNGSPTSWENLLCAIREAGKVKNVIQYHHII